MKVGTKILAGFALAIAVAAGIGGASYASARRIAAQLDDAVANDEPALVALGNVAEALALAAHHLDVLYLRDLAPDDAIRKAAHEGHGAALAQVEDSRAAFAKTSHEDRVARPWREAQPKLDAWVREVRAASAAIAEWEQAQRAGRPDAAAAYQRAWSAYLAQDAARVAADRGINALQEILERDAAETRHEADQISSAALATVVVSVVLGAVLLLAVGLLAARAIGRALRGLAGEAQKLTAAVDRGALDVRGDVAAVHPEFQPIIQGMNATMDAFARPMRLAVQHVERISRGDLPPPIADAFQGDFERMKTSLDRCVAAVNGLVADVKALAGAAVEGDLAKRADASRHEGEFRAIVQGVNGTLDAVLAPIHEAGEVLDALAQRDLRARMAGEYRGDHVRMKEALNATADALHEALAAVSSAAGEVAGAAGQIASSSEAVAQGAGEQAAALEETSSSLESMTSTTRHAADSAQQASALAAAARSSASEGAAAMERMSGAMANIRVSAEGTSQIIKDINEIAFQTNLLALNAAVEAARAGAAGRGFAVVAEEVRSLALRSKEAANKTEELIRESVRQAGEGEATSRHVSEKLTGIVDLVGKVTDVVGEIAAATREQAAGTDQVTRAVTQMNHVTQQNAASSEQTSSSAQELSAQSERLATLVRSFQLGEARA
jgi:methyl-accepting chemotaxis protein